MRFEAGMIAYAVADSREGSPAEPALRYTSRQPYVPEYCSEYELPEISR